VAGHELADVFGEVDFAPVLVGNEVGGVDEVGGELGFEGLLADGFGHGVVGARKDGFGVAASERAIFLEEFFAESGGDSDDGDLGFLEEVAFLVEGFLEIEIFGGQVGVGHGVSI